MPKAKVAILKTTPRTVLRDYHELLNLAGYQDVIAKDADTALDTAEEPAFCVSEKAALVAFRQRGVWKLSGINAATGVKRQTTSNSAGIYRFDAVDLGTYSVQASAPGFANTLKRTIRTSDVGIAAFRQDGQCVMVNPSFAQTVGGPQAAVAVRELGLDVVRVGDRAHDAERTRLWARWSAIDANLDALGWMDSGKSNASGVSKSKHF